MDTPEFQNTHLWDRLCWAKENIEPYESKYPFLTLRTPKQEEECLRLMHNPSN